MAWYSKLFNYPDNDLIPKIVDKVVVSHIVKVLDIQWNTSDTVQTESVGGLIEEVIVHVGGEDKKGSRELIDKVLAKLKEHVDKTIQNKNSALVASMYLIWTRLERLETHAGADALKEMGFQYMPEAWQK